MTNNKIKDNLESKCNKRLEVIESQTMLFLGKKLTCDDWVSFDGYNWSVDSWICRQEGIGVVKRSLHKPDVILTLDELDVLFPTYGEGILYDIDEIK